MTEVWLVESRSHDGAWVAISRPYYMEHDALKAVKRLESGARTAVRLEITAEPRQYRVGHYIREWPELVEALDGLRSVKILHE